MDYYPSHHRRDYLTKIKREAFIEVFNRWLSDCAPGVNFSKEITAIVTIHANLTYLAKTVSYGESFELEHIIPRKLISTHDNKNPKKVMGNSVGNCMYLPRIDNNKKKDKTLYDVNQAGRYDKLIRESLYFSQPELDMAIKAIERHEFAVANEEISRRARKVAEATIEALLA